MRGTGIFKGLGLTVRHWFEKDITIQYPEEPAKLYPAFRGCLTFIFEKCIACGLCVKACPNQVLSLETVKDEATGKKKLMTYKIDLQYCMFCNFCVEACPKDCLSFNHDFELAQYRRDDIRITYERPADLDQRLADAAAAPASDSDAEAAAKKQKQIDAMNKALAKNAGKVVAKYLAEEAEAAVAGQMLMDDAEKRSAIARLLVEDKERVTETLRAYLTAAKAEKGGES